MRKREKVVHTSIAFSSSREIFWISWTWIRIELLFGGCEIETMTEVVEFASRNGRWRVLVDGIHEFGAIMKKPWLHTASFRLNVVMHSPNGKCNKWRLHFFFFLSYFVFLISCLQMLALDLQHHNTFSFGYLGRREISYIGI